MLNLCIFFILYFGKPKIDTIFATKKIINIFYYEKSI